MTIDLVTFGDSAYLTGVYTQTSTTASVLLGPTATSANYGGHFVGVDPLYDSPIYVRAYADPTTMIFDPFGVPLAWAARYARLGYIQFMQVQVAGVAVPPSVLGGDIARRQDYATGADNDYWFVDFMSPGDALARLPSGEPPFFAYNGMLLSPVSEIEQFGGFLAPTGSLWLPSPPGSLPNPMLGPSMLAQINVPLVTADVISTIISRLKPMVDVVVGESTLATTPLYQVCIDAIRAATDNPWVTESDRALTLADISRIRIAGEYLLLNIANAEHLEPVLCAQLVRDSSATRLRIYLFDYDHYRGLEELATLGLIQRTVNFVESTGGNMAEPSLSPSGRGGGGLYRPSIAMQDGAPLLRINIAAIVFGRRRIRLRYPRYPGSVTPISGVTLGLRWRYDGATRIMVYDGIETPRWTAGGDDRFRLALAQYFDTIGSQEPSRTTIDVSYFNLIGTPWAAPNPSLARPARLADWEDADGVTAS